MMQSSKRAMLVAGVLGLALMQGCATKVKATATMNPAPAEAFSAYGRIELKPTVFRQGYRGDYKALSKIEENIKKDLSEPLLTWNSKAENGRTLTVQPVVEQIDFTHGATRVMLGPLVGGSGVLIRLNITDASGRQVANPEFFQSANAWAGAFTLGVHDNLMLTRVANLASGYVIANYRKAQGGPTGADPKAVAAN